MPMPHSNAASPSQTAAPRPGSLRIPLAVLDHFSNLHGAEFKVLLMLCRQQSRAGGKDQQPFPYSIPQIERDTGLSPRAITEATSLLQERHLIRRLEKRGARPNRYQVLFNPAAPQKAPEGPKPVAAAQPKQRRRKTAPGRKQGAAVKMALPAEKPAPIPERRQEIPRPSVPPAKPVESAPAAPPATVTPPSPTISVAPVAPATPAVATLPPPTPPLPAVPGRSIPKTPTAQPFDMVGLRERLEREANMNFRLEDLVAYNCNVPVTADLIRLLIKEAGSEDKLREALDILRPKPPYHDSAKLVADIRSVLGS